MKMKRKTKTIQQRMYLLIGVVAVGFILSTLVSSFSLSEFAKDARHSTRQLLAGQETSNSIKTAELELRLRLAEVLRGYVEVENAFSLSEKEIEMLRDKIKKNTQRIDGISQTGRKATQNATAIVEELHLSEQEAERPRKHISDVDQDFQQTAASIKTLAEKADQIEFSSLKDETQAVLEASAKLENSTNNLQNDFAKLRKENEEKQGELVNRFVTQLIIAAVILFLLAGGLAVRLARSISTRLAQTIHALNALANGSTDVQLPPQGGNDDISLLREAYRNLREGVIEKDEMAKQEQERERIEKNRSNAIMAACTSFDQDSSSLVSSLDLITNELNQTIDMVSAESNEAANSSHAVSDSASQASQEARNVAVASEQLTASVAQVVSQAQETAQRSDAANQAVKNATQNVAELEAASQSINSVLSIIQDLSEQTNLLALNATIEAGRAGEAGKGFGVVAAEVKALSKQTADAADNIANRIEKMKSASSNVSSLLGEVGDKVADINVMANHTVQAMEQQNSAVREVSQNIDAIAMRLHDVDEETSRLFASSERSNSASRTLKELVERTQHQAKSVAQAFSSFSKEVQNVQQAGK